MRDGAIRTKPRALLEEQGPKSMAPLLPHLRHGRFTFKPEWGQPSDGVKLELLLLIQTPSVESLHLNGFVQLTQIRLDFLSGLKTLIMEQCARISYGLYCPHHLVLPAEFLVGTATGTGQWDLELWKLVPRCLEYLLIGGLENEVMLAFAQQEVLELVKRKSIVAPKLNRILLQNISPVKADGGVLMLLKEASRENQVWLST
ncbi:hypothetical protein V501_07782 [Pseudogymnoascus sp. VKM F-4519 (FW-2642)]|nr:hypothetical protein V501_07782 [Pseudogymnoascus sp. VKM F-4519 (FW-2642)]